MILDQMNMAVWCNGMIIFSVEGSWKSLSETCTCGCGRAPPPTWAPVPPQPTARLSIFLFEMICRTSSFPSLVYSIAASGLCFRCRV